MPHYTSVAQALHWLIALIIIGNLIGGLTLGFMDSADPDMKALAGRIIGLHKALGLSVIALTLVRIGWRLANPPPPLPAYMTPLERGLARATHLGFYALMLALPLSGWAMVSAGKVGVPTSLFWLFEVPALPVPKGLGAALATSHALLGWVMLATLALHVLAVVKHKILDRDNLLARMLPGIMAG